MRKWAMLMAVAVVAVAWVGIAHAAKPAPTAAQVARLQSQVKSQKALIAQLRLEIASLKAQLGKPGATPGTTTTAAPNTLGTRANPYPADTGVLLNGGWAMKVTGITPNANDQVAAANRYNDPPGAGRQYFIVTVSVTKGGSDSRAFLASRLRLVGASAVEYASFTDRCGVIPDPVPITEVFPGGTIQGNICWAVRSSDLGTLLMYDGDSTDRKYMKIG